ncbi:MAG: glutamate 5-kinase [Candidatus Paceibacterota bacterium]|jgi:glutamate 5-kinase
MKNDITIVKVGSNTIIDENGNIRLEIVRDIVTSLQDVIKNGGRVVLVTSGAVRLGRVALGKDTPATVAASVGQTHLFAAYYQEAEKINLKLAEFLLTRPYIVTREYFLKLQETFNSLLDQGILPIVNENDALVVHTDWSLGDNDSLSAILAISLKAKRLIILSHIDGLFDSDPSKDSNAKLIKTVQDVNNELMKHCSPDISAGGRGGMLSKLKAARLVTAVGIKTQIISGLTAGNLTKALNNEEIGTTFLPRKSNESISNRERWLLAAKNSAGSIEIDAGAVAALKNGKSLLAVGVKNVNGQFNKKEIVEIVDAEHQGIAFGIVDYSSSEIEEMLSTKNLKDIQLMHTDNLMII